MIVSTGWIGRLGAATVALLLPSLLLWTAASPASAATGKDEVSGNLKLIESVESNYNSIFLYKSDHHVHLTFGHNKRLYTESVGNPYDPTALPVDYTRTLTASLAYVSQPKSMLMIGMGGGTTSTYLERSVPQLTVTDVELDPEVARLAEKHFGVKESARHKVVIQDGRLFLHRTKDTYDLIMIDAYRGPFVPFHLLTKEFYELVNTKLAPGGVVVQNVEPSTMLFDSAVATVKSVYKNVDFYYAGGNVVLVAYSGLPRERAGLLKRAEALDAQYRFRYPLADIMKRERRADPLDLRGKVLTDDFAPVESLHAISRHNLKWADK
jgi:spermidine synthase